MHKEHHGFLYGIIAAVSGSGMALFVKLASSVPVTTLVFVRFSLALPLLAWTVFYQKKAISLKSIPKHLLRSLAGLGALYLYFYSVSDLPLVNAVTLVNTAPLFMPLIVLVWMKLVVSKRRYLAIAVGFIGVVILLQPSNDMFSQIGSIAGLASGFFGAIALLGVRQLSKTESTETILAYYFFLCTIISFFPALLNWKHIPDWSQWLYLILSGLFALVYQYTLTKAYTHAPATKVSTVNYLGVLFGGLYGWVIFGEVPNYWVLIGAGLIICGALLALFDPSKPRKLGGR